MAPSAAEHVDALVRLHVASWQRTYAGIFPDAYLDSLTGEIPARVARLRRTLARGDQSTGFVALDADGTVGGFARFGAYLPEDGDPDPLDDRWGEIYAIYVDPARAGTGAGHALMTAALAALHPAPVALWVLAANEVAQRFYRRHGFVPDGVTAPYERGGVAAVGRRYLLTR